VNIFTGSGHFHTPGTAFQLIPGGGMTEFSSRAYIHHSYLWPAAETPPAFADPGGSDLFVETDSGSARNEAHLMVRDDSCSGAGGAWRDAMTGKCRCEDGKYWDAAANMGAGACVAVP
jgi:hypothetical protein